MSPNLFDTRGFPPRWSCGVAWEQEPAWGWLHICADIAVWAAYMAIPLVLLYFLRRRKDLPFPAVFYLFGAFILACGTSHLIDALIFWWPAYRLSAVIRLVTAGVSWLTIFALIRIAPAAMRLRSPVELEQEVARRTAELADVNEKLQLAMDEKRQVTLERIVNEERLTFALEAAGIGTWDWDLTENVVLFNSVQAELTGVGTETLRVHSYEFFELIHPDDRDRVREEVQRSIETGVPYHCEFRMHPLQGGLRWLIGEGQVRDDGRRMVGVNYDITARKELEISLENARRAAEAANAAKSRFLANMSHEIRTPLTAILGAADLLVEDLEDSEASEMAVMIGNQGKLLLGILNDVLDLAKIEAGKLPIRKRRCSLVQVVADVRSLMEPIAQEKELDLEVELIDRLPPTLHTDPIRLRQILVNLVGNALKFTEVGNVRIRVQLDEGPETTGVVFSVVDTGVGISPEDQKAIFEAFTQVEQNPEATQSGTGLGLAICRRLAKLLGGSLKVESAPGKGSCFSIRLPAPRDCELAVLDLQEAESTTANRDPSVSAPILPLKVLAAEDARSIQFLLRRLVGKVVEQLDIVSDGAAAVDAVTAAQQSGHPYDIILMDMQMPVLDGYSATKRLRDAGITTPIVALTASAMAGDREDCLEVGCNGYVPKPLNQKELLGEIRRLAPKPGNEKPSS